MKTLALIFATIALLFLIWQMAESIVFFFNHFRK